MARAPKDILYIGIGSHAVAIDGSTGAELWRTKLKSSSFVTVYHADKKLYAGAAGQLFCLDAATGEILWRNELVGLGTSIVAFSAGNNPSAAAALVAQQAAIVAATAAVAAAT